MLDLFAPPPEEVIYVGDAEVRPRYRYWRVRQLYTTFIGYAMFYFVRKNIPLALPLMETELHIGKDVQGLILTLQDVIYGVSKFVNGMLADRANARWFMALGLLLSAVMNWIFGISSALVTLAVVWMLNGWFQGMGFPPVARVLAHWFAPRERGTMWGLWNCSHQVGGALILLLAGYLAQHYGWRACFVVPALLATITSVFIMERLRDTPGSLGLPPVEAYTGDEPVPATSTASMDALQYWTFLERHVFSNANIWLVCVANFFVYVVRYGFVNWTPSYLNQARGMPLTEAGGTVAGFEVAGMVGSLVAGWLTDRFFGSRRAPVCTIFMLGTTIFVLLFWLVPPGSVWTAKLMLWMVGFLDYGPQFLVGVMVADLATKQAAATAIGLTGFFGYMSGVISGWGLGWVILHYGWNGGFGLLLVCALAGTVPFALVWNAAPARE